MKIQEGIYVEGIIEALKSLPPKTKVFFQFTDFLTNNTHYPTELEIVQVGPKNREYAVIQMGMPE